MQAQPADVSLALYTFVRLAYEPATLLDALEAGLPLRVHAFLSDPESCVKICWCMATFNCFRPRLFAVAMQAMCHMEEGHFSNAMLYEVTVAHQLASHAKCASRRSCARGLAVRCPCRCVLPDDSRVMDFVLDSNHDTTVFCRSVQASGAAGAMVCVGKGSEESPSSLCR